MPKREIAGEEQPGDGQLSVLRRNGGTAGRARASPLPEPPEPQHRQREKHAIEGGGAGANLTEPHENRGERNSHRAGQQRDKGDTGFFLHR